MFPPRWPPLTRLACGGYEPCLNPDFLDILDGLCRDFACQAPVTDPEAFRAQLEALVAHR